MQRGAVRRVDRALEHLRPVAVDVDLDDAGANCGRGRPCRRLEVGHLFAAAHPDPDEAAGLAAWIGLVPELSARARFRAARTACRRRCPRRRSSSRGTGSAARTPRCGRARARRAGAGSARRARRAARRCRETRPDPRRAGARAPASPSGSADFLRQARGKPMLAHQAAHRRVAFDAAQAGHSLRSGQHGSSAMARPHDAAGCHPARHNIRSLSKCYQLDTGCRELARGRLRIRDGARARPRRASFACPPWRLGLADAERDRFAAIAARRRRGGKIAEDIHTLRACATPKAPSCRHSRPGPPRGAGSLRAFAQVFAVQRPRANAIATSSRSSAKRTAAAARASL